MFTLTTLTPKSASTAALISGLVARGETLNTTEFVLCHDLALFVFSGVLLNLTPGPDTLFIVSHAARGGARAGSGQDGYKCEEKDESSHGVLSF